MMVYHTFIPLVTLSPTKILFNITISIKIFALLHSPRMWSCYDGEKKKTNLNWSKFPNCRQSMQSTCCVLFSTKVSLGEFQHPVGIACECVCASWPKMRARKKIRLNSFRLNSTHMYIYRIHINSQSMNEKKERKKNIYWWNRCGEILAMASNKNHQFVFAVLCVQNIPFILHKQNFVFDAMLLLLA